jgi:AcrR family transcriptional regulator
LNDQSTGKLEAATRDRIVQVAADLFHEHGFTATGIATVLKKARVKSGSLYHFFPSKEALLEAVLERHIQLLGPTLLSPAEAAVDDPIERVFSLLDLYRRNLKMTGYRRGCPVGNLALEVGDQFPNARMLMERYFGQWADAVLRWLEEARERLPLDVDRDALSRHVLAVMEGGVLQARVQRSVAALDASVAQLRAHLELLEQRARPTAEGVLPTEVNNGERASDTPGWRTW